MYQLIIVLENPQFLKIVLGYYEENLDSNKRVFACTPLVCVKKKKPSYKLIFMSIVLFLYFSQVAP